MTETYPTLAQCALVAAAFKVLLFPAYKSTDFEVHRNWLAITDSLPLSEWYFEDTSEWTLDYPPFFAYFEWVLAQIARLADPLMLRLYNLGYDSWETVYFQRTTVIITELLLVYVLQLYIDSTPLSSKRAAQAAALSIVLSPGLFMIDHIHFQYNGFMYGILVWSLVLARRKSTLLGSGLVFAALLCFKHIHLYLAPAWFVYLLRTYCLSAKSIFRIRFFNCVKLGGGIAAVFAAAFGPFAAIGKDQIPQIFSRLFPFSRGLCHAYWAPNVWALYSLADRILIHLAPRLGLTIRAEALKSVTRGLVGDSTFAVLPEISPRICFLLTLFFQVLPLIKLFLSPSWENFVGAVTLCGYASFLFGWHVHEKAILLVIIPFTLIAIRDRRHLGAFRPLAVAGHVSLFPLLFTPAEFPLKTIYTVVWLVLFLMAFDRLTPASDKPRIFLLDRFSTLYIAVSIPLIVYSSLLHQIMFGDSFQFLPLMFTSSYTAIGVIGSWLGYMVLFKRKPVQFLPPLIVDDEDVEVWHIPQTGEVFASYEEYLTRMDFYNQRRFNDQITGHSGLTFFEAYKSELTGGREVEATFPEALKGPILRKVQFQTISRLDNLVDKIFDEFKQEFFPGERVTVTTHVGDRVHGLVRDKMAFGPRVLPDGTRSLPTTRYHVTFKDSGGEAMVTDEHICRERGVFTKAMLRSFIKKTVSREAWNGAPWLVKHECAEQYQIDTRIPPHLLHDTKIMERKQLQAQKRASLPHDFNGINANLHQGPVRLPELKPAPKAHKVKPGQNGHGTKGPLPEHIKDGDHHHNILQMHDQRHQVREPTPPPPPPPPPKYPIEDLQLEPRSGMVRPSLKFMCKDPPMHADPIDPLYEDIEMNSVGYFLETWDTLNVYCEIFTLDSFTFDDFVESMLVTSEHVRPQLLDEIHCSVLKVLVDSESDGGRVRINLPELDEDGSDEDEDDENAKSEEPEPEPKPVGRATRSSLAKLEAERLAAEAAAAEEESLRAELATKHRAEELMQDYDWIDHLRKRDFANGAWLRIMVGLFYQLSKGERHQKVCEHLLLQLVPPDVEPTQETVQQQYAIMDVNSRIQALQIICMLTMETKAVRGYMEDCAETMTKYRKDKIEWQRQKRQAIEELRPLNEQRKILLPDNMPPSPARNENGDLKQVDGDESTIDREEDGDESLADAAKRKRRRQSDKQRKHEQEQERKAKEKAQKEAAKLPPGQSKQFVKLLKDIQKKEDVIKKCEEEIAIIENDLREADCPRTRVMGKDRFWNRYYWFERNGMPYAGLPDSSTASAGYANGCVWVQGPDDIEREGYIEVPLQLQTEYQAKFGMTIPERKSLEEGKTSLFTARQWGYISEPEHLDELIRWLDPRGFNESKLRKELVTFRDKMITNMENRKKYMGSAGEKDRKDDTKRTSHRIRDKTPESRNYRCLQWENTMALENLGHLHSDPPPPPRARKQTKKREAIQEAGPAPAMKTRRR
ncbi:hypothetical protein S40285_00488 [Stachybotrys chlorohalonatus IBT 40285]|uniref:Dolichyl pyrophosphate Glc1Man9GlcNAc2 alpha-1,3-glucosyltransferase n=1 Tax=Stachybotrys chlorohalonatus (strain IBT 40285) TaxID=1283841 RepID=A0A084QNC2_STAC4|nr:hypothetical protein S40285_00488 [Stachybotrys chlorohalonata IBT 40285]